MVFGKQPQLLPLAIAIEFKTPHHFIDPCFLQYDLQVFVKALGNQFSGKTIP